MNQEPSIIIHLEKLRFFAYHGLYENEKTAGNEFELNLSLSFRQSGIIKHINETINYVEIYELVAAEMLQPRELLETFIAELAEKMKLKFPQIIQIHIKLYKLTAPITGLNGKVGVELNKNWS